MELEELRAQIDAIDRSMLELFCKRMDITGLVAEYKIAHSMPVLRQDREDAILESVRERAEAVRAGYGEYAAGLFREIMKLSRDNQNKIMERTTGDD